MNIKVEAKEVIECAVIGAGIVGLFTALELIRNGQRVTIYSDNFHELNSKSKTGPALVPRVFMPNHYDWAADQLKHELLAKIAYDYLRESAKLSRYQSVRGIRTYDLANSKDDLKEVVSEYVYDTFEEGHVRFEGRGSQKGVSYSTILTDTAFLAEELRIEILLRGGKLVQKRFNTQEDVLGLKESYIFNCSNSASVYLFNDKELEHRSRVVLEY
jgi:anaerobic glycerol-3-phosphate dehydrogenase